MMKALSLPCCNDMFGDDPLYATGGCMKCGPSEYWIDAAWQEYKVPIIIGAVVLLMLMTKK